MWHSNFEKFFISALGVNYVSFEIQQHRTNNPISQDKPRIDKKTYM